MNEILFKINNRTFQGNLKSGIFALLFIILFVSGCSSSNQDNPDTTTEQESIDEEISEGDEESMNNILLTINNETFEATLFENKTTEALKKQLPLTILMTELHGNEKYFTLDEPLPTEEEQIDSIKSGDLMLFRSDTFVLFYEDFSTSYSYTRIGTIDNIDNLSNILGSSDVDVHIELAD